MGRFVFCAEDLLHLCLERCTLYPGVEPLSSSLDELQQLCFVCVASCGDALLQLAKLVGSTLCTSAHLFAYACPNLSGVAFQPGAGKTIEAAPLCNLLWHGREASISLLLQQRLDRIWNVVFCEWLGSCSTARSSLMASVLFFSLLVDVCGCGSAWILAGGGSTNEGIKRG